MKYNWNLTDIKDVKKNGLKVFSCFSCGGGSSMGYKMTGFDVIGCNEIDPKMMEVYNGNFEPKYAYLEGIQTFKDRDDLPEELYDLDILDGSPPCSNFSMAGNREKDWGKKKKFREGQKEQVLDTLFFDFIDLAKKLQPKVIIAENVKGILQGEAIEYVKKILKDFEDAGYYTHHWLLDASTMGVPQRRERVFSISIRKDLVDKIPGSKQTLFNQMPYLDLYFDEKRVLYKEFKKVDGSERGMSDLVKKYWSIRKKHHKRMSDVLKDLGMKDQRFGVCYVLDEKTPMTITSSGAYYREDTPSTISITDLKNIGSFPQDYKFNRDTLNSATYIIGMSVPPLMIYQIANRIKEQWFDKLSTV